MSGPYIISGIGLISPLGNTPGSTFDALIAGRRITTHARCNGPVNHSSVNPIAVTADPRLHSASVQKSSLRDGGAHASQLHLPRVSALGFIAAQQAITSAGWSDHELDDPQTGLIIATSRGPADAWLQQSGDPQELSLTNAMGITAPPNKSATSDNPAGRSHPEISPASHALVAVYDDVFAQSNRTNPSRLDWGIGRVMTDLAMAVGHGSGPRWCISAACASGLHAITRAVLALACGEVRRVLIIGTESSLHPLFLRSFSRLGVLPADGEICRPFDENRSGFLMAESAAAICLEPVDQPSPGQICITHAHMAADASHLTAIHPSGRIIEHLLMACTQGQPSIQGKEITRGGAIDLFHAHGTGTAINDPIELAAISRFTLGSSRQKMTSDDPAVWSHKAAIGHTLGAAGLVAIVLNAMIHQRGIIPGNINTTHPLDASGLILSRDSIRRPVQNSVCLAAGFGGSAGIVRMQTCD